MGRAYLGELEELVLLAAMGLGDEAYGASILSRLDAEAGREVPRGSIYVTIDRLESKGLVETYAAESTPSRRGRPRRLVRVTEEGQAAVLRSHEVRERLRDGLRPVAQP